MHNAQPIRDGRCPTTQSQIFHTLDIMMPPLSFRSFAPRVEVLTPRRQQYFPTPEDGRQFTIIVGTLSSEIPPLFQFSI